MNFEAESLKSKALKTNLDVHIPQLVSLSIFASCSVFVLLYAFGDDEIREILIFTMPVLAGGGTVYGAFYAKAAFIANIERDRIQHTLEMLAAQNTPDFVSLYIHMQNRLKTDQVIDWEEAFKSDPKLEVSFNLVLASFEDMADAAYLRHIDERTIYLANSEIMPLCFSQLHDYIMMVRNKRQSDSYLIQYESLCKSWAAGNYLNGEPILLEDLIKSCKLPAYSKRKKTY